MRFLLFILSVIALVSYATPHIAHVHPASKDSVRYVYKFQIPAEQFKPTLDTIDVIMQGYGKSLSVDQADFNREAMTRQVVRLISGMKLDSVVIKGGK